MSSGKHAVLLMAYGAPKDLDEVEAFYTNILRGKCPPQGMVERLKARYRAIGGKSPLTAITYAQARLLQEALNTRPFSPIPRPISVYVGMKHWHPFIAEGVERMAKDGVEKAVGIILAPHYSRFSVAEYIRAANEAIVQFKAPLKFSFVESWATHPKLIQCFAEQIRRAWERFNPSVQDQVQLVFTAHSLPRHIIEGGDPYPDEVKRTCEGIASLLGIPKWHLAYQSASGHDWLGPDVLGVLDELARKGKRYVLIAPVGFLCDHLEILYDIDIEAHQRAKELGITLHRMPMPNTDPLLIDALADIALNAFQGKRDGFRIAPNPFL